MMLYSFMDKVMKGNMYWNSLVVKPCLLILEVFWGMDHPGQMGIMT
jgi:hypothetical protein